jgi:hypothetical protein
MRRYFTKNVRYIKNNSHVLIDLMKQDEGRQSLQNRDFVLWNNKRCLLPLDILTIVQKKKIDHLRFLMTTTKICKNVFFLNNSYESVTKTCGRDINTMDHITSHHTNTTRSASMVLFWETQNSWHWYYTCTVQRTHTQTPAQCAITTCYLWQ